MFRLKALYYVVCPGCGDETFWEDGNAARLDGSTLKCPTCQTVFRVTTSPDFRENLAWLTAAQRVS